MGDKSKIEWTDATWNPIVGCSIVSPGCTNCYAMKAAHRIQAMSDGTHAAIVGARGMGLSLYDGTTKVVNGNPVWAGELRICDDHKLTSPMRWKQPRMVFVNSMGDLFHEGVPDEWIDQVFAVMALCPQHTFQVLTKRAERMREYLSKQDKRGRHAAMAYAALMAATGRWNTPELDLKSWPLPNVWLGVSAEDQIRADERIPHLIKTPAAIRFVSAEPLLGQIDLSGTLAVEQVVLSIGPHWTERTGAVPKIDWVIAGGESGRNARPMHPDWARFLRDQCRAAGVAFFFKQHGEFVSVSMVEGDGRHFRFPDGATVRRAGKRAAGRVLDGREHNDMPERANG